MRTASPGIMKFAAACAERCLPRLRQGIPAPASEKGFSNQRPLALRERCFCSSSRFRTLRAVVHDVPISRVAEDPIALPGRQFLHDAELLQVAQGFIRRGALTTDGAGTGRNRVIESRPEFEAQGSR